jgi:quercetin 2,3-dioxygenase
MTVRRVLPHRARTTIGPWCFLDHFGPNSVSQSGGMVVPPHPHTGLQTVTWLFEGAIEHKDSTGGFATITPGSMNLMTAGSGIQHSEISDPESSILHGVQLWVALPDEYRFHDPHFDSLTTQAHPLGDGSLRLFLGALEGVGVAQAPIYSPLVAAEISLPPGGEMALTVQHGFEHGLLADTGTVTMDGETIDPHYLGFCPVGSRSLKLVNHGTEPFRGILIGGEPLGEPLVMWWNFVGRSHEEIEEFREDWQQGLQAGSPRYGHLENMDAIPAPELPHVRLKARPSQ